MTPRAEIDFKRKLPLQTASVSRGWWPRSHCGATGVQLYGNLHPGVYWIPPFWGAGESSLQESVSLGALHSKTTWGRCQGRLLVTRCCSSCALKPAPCCRGDTGVTGAIARETAWLKVSGTREAVHTRELGAGEAVPIARACNYETLHAPREPHAREAAGSAGACLESILKPRRKNLLLL